MKFWRESSFVLRAALLASLCLNVVMATYVSLQWIGTSGAVPVAVMPLRLIDRVAERLPKKDADTLWAIYRSKEVELLPLQTDYRRALMKALQVAGQSRLDNKALEAAVGDARDKRIKIGDAVIATFTEMLEQISPEGRRQLVGGYFR